MRATLVAVCVALCVLFVHFRLSDPIPALSEVSGDKMEIRRFETLLLPLDGRSLAAIRSQLDWRFNRSGEARLYRLLEAQSSSNKAPLVGAFRDAGYQFPHGSDAQSYRTYAGVYIEISHYPAILEHIERTFQLTRVPDPPSRPRIPKEKAQQDGDGDAEEAF